MKDIMQKFGSLPIPACYTSELMENGFSFVGQHVRAQSLACPFVEHHPPSKNPSFL